VLVSSNKGLHDKKAYQLQLHEFCQSKKTMRLT